MGAAAYLISSSRNKQVKTISQTSQRMSSDVEPVINYVESFVENAARQGLLLLGEQGGVIFKSQGGNIMDYSPDSEGKLYIPYGAHNPIKVPYVIDLPTGSSLCAPTLPGYPLKDNKYYPFKDNSKFTDSNIDYTQAHGCFGSTYLLPETQMSQGLEKFITEEIKSGLSFSSFPNFDITYKDVSTKILNAKHDMKVEVSFPIKIEEKNTGAEQTLEKVIVSLPISIKSTREFVHDLVDLDVTDPTYVISNGIPGTGYSAHIDEDYYNYDDIIIITPPYSKLGEDEFRFLFARRNRPPALEYVHDTNFAITRSSGDIVRWSNLINQEVHAVDPDEDKVNISIRIGTGLNARNLYKDEGKYEMPSCSSSTECHLSAFINASDNEFMDYQPFIIDFSQNEE